MFLKINRNQWTNLNFQDESVLMLLCEQTNGENWTFGKKNIDFKEGFNPLDCQIENNTIVVLRLCDCNLTDKFTITIKMFTFLFHIILHD